MNKKEKIVSSVKTERVELKNVEVKLEQVENTIEKPKKTVVFGYGVEYEVDLELRIREMVPGYRLNKVDHWHSLIFTFGKDFCGAETKITLPDVMPDQLDKFIKQLQKIREEMLPIEEDMKSWEKRNQ